MKIELLNLTIENFKGIKELNLNLNGGNAWIKGENGTGKTTVADAFFWLFSNSNSDQRSNFNIIPLDQSGSVIDFIKPTVEAEIKADGHKIRLKKVYKQVWTKKRGAEQQELTGHTTDYFFDDVPVSKSDYENRLNEVVKSDLFRSLADVKYFCGSTTPQYRRNVLIDVAGDITDEDIISEYADLSELPSILNERSIDDYRKVLNRNRRAINRKLDEIPASIKERLHGRPDIENISAGSLTDQLTEIDDGIAQYRQKIAELGTGIDLATKKTELIKAQSELDGIQGQVKKRYEATKMELSGNKNSKLMDSSLKHHELTTTINQINQLEADMALNKNRRDKLMDDWETENRKRFQSKPKCFACGQSLPPEMIGRQREDFNKNQDKVLAAIELKGDDLKNQFESMQKKHETETKHAEYISREIETINDRIKEIDANIEQIEKDIIAATHNEAKPIRERIAGLTTEIESINDGMAPKRKAIEDAISSMVDNRKIVQAELDKITKAREIDDRVDELELELKAQGKALERNAYEAGLLDKFLRYRAEYIENTVSGHFEITEWKLFEELIGGGYKDVCEPLFEGIPYNTDLNTGARLNVGLDVIATLSKRYDIKCPVFIDNAESITSWIPTDQQIIRLVADDGVTGLTVKHE